MNAPLTPVERTAASEAIQRRDRRIESLEEKVLTCPNCGAIMACGFCGFDPHAKPEERVSHD
jgi:hypothetical protein